MTGTLYPAIVRSCARTVSVTTRPRPHITSATSMSVATDDGSTREVTFDKLIIAAGATTRMLPGMEVSRNVVTYEEQILDENLPSSIVIAGSGAIGVEFAYVLKNFGVDVTIVEFLDRMVPTEDEEISKELAKHYKKLGVKVMLSTKVESVEDTGSGVKVTVSPAKGGDQQVLEADKLLSAIGFAVAAIPVAVVVLMALVVRDVLRPDGDVVRTRSLIVATGASAMRASVGDIASASDNLARRTEQQAAALEQAQALTSLAVGLTVSSLAYIGFDMGLGLNLPSGILGGAF